MHNKWERSNLETYVLFDKKKWRYSDQDKDGMLNRQEYEYFHHPKEHEIMLPYVAVVGEQVWLVWLVLNQLMLYLNLQARDLLHRRLKILPLTL